MITLSSDFEDLSDDDFSKGKCLMAQIVESHADVSNNIIGTLDVDLSKASINLKSDRDSTLVYQGKECIRYLDSGYSRHMIGVKGVGARSEHSAQRAKMSGTWVKTTYFGNGTRTNLSNSDFLLSVSKSSSQSNYEDHPIIAKDAKTSNQEDYVLNNTNECSNPRIIRDYPESQIIGDVNFGILTRSRVDINFCMLGIFFSMIELKNVTDALKEVEWIKTMQDELNEFELHRVWTLVPKTQRKTIIGTCWEFINKMNEDEIIIRNKARLVA
ncbi:unnamed protein product [Lactuca saligna]|uniref:Reverse transcriptase Ty1/copia-type domain-containing protein n=1 Tax=Lactuca saligna TaxID=75948 RepID=A0AA35V793_LACSI|nr:unnamed protein product [Lactuca saligna]